MISVPNDEMILSLKRNTFEAVTRLCLKIAYGNFDEEVGGYQEESEISALETYAAKFGPSFPVKAYSKVLFAIICTSFAKKIYRRKELSLLAQIIILNLLYRCYQIGRQI